MLRRFCNLCGEEIKENESIFRISFYKYDKEKRYNRHEESFDDICSNCLQKVQKVLNDIATERIKNKGE